MKITFQEETLYGIKYKVNKIDNSTFIMFPISLVKGKEDKLGFKTDTEILHYARNREDLKSRFVVDKTFLKEELEYMYDYDGEEEFLTQYFFEENKNIVRIVIIEDKNHVSKIDLNYKMIADQSCDAVYCMDRAYPSILLNNTALEELYTCRTKRDLDLILEKYKERLKSFKDDNLNRKISRIYVSNGKVNYLETLKSVPRSEIDKSIEKITDKDYIIKSEKIDESGISYNGLRKYIKERVYGHDKEIDTFAQKIYMNYTAKDDEPVDSILFVGPTGTGKTETVHAACEYLDIPSYEVNASNLVPQGIKGMSIEDVIIGLYEKSGRDIRKAEKGIIFLDEFDKLNDTDLETKEPVKNILLTFTAGGNFPIDNERYGFNFNSSRTTKIYAGVFDRISEKIKSLGFNSILELNEVLGTDEEIRKKIIEKDYFTQEELSRISTILAYNDLDRDTKKQILTGSKLSEYTKKRDRYKRQFGIDLKADDEFFDALLDTSDKEATGMRSVNNYLKRKLNDVERKILEGEVPHNKQLILTRDTVSDSNKFQVK